MDIKLFCQVVCYETKEFWKGLSVILIFLGLSYGIGRIILHFTSEPGNDFDLLLKSLLIGCIILFCLTLIIWGLRDLFSELKSKVEDIWITYKRAECSKKEQILREKRDKEEITLK